VTIPLTTSGGLFTRLGHIFGAMNDINALRGNTANYSNASAGGLGPVARGVAGISPMYNRLNTTIQADFTASPNDYYVIDGFNSALNFWQQSQKSFMSQLAALAANTVIQMANNDTPLKAVNLQNAMALLYSQMVTNTDYLSASSVSIGAQTAVGSPNGNAIIITSTKNGSGLIGQTIFPETLTFTCSNDAFNGTATAYQEPFGLTGAAVVGDAFYYTWPGGSGVSGTLKTVDSFQNNSGGNSLVNSDFPTFTNANVPDNWTIQIGSAGTQVKEAVGTSYDTQSANSLNFVGDGSNLTCVTQAFNTASSSGVGAGGTPFKLAAATQYAVNLWIKMDAGGAPASGVLEIALVDGTAGIGTVTQDAQAVNNSFTFALTGVADTLWHNVNGVFRTPALLSGTQPYRLRIRLSTFLTNARNVYISRVGFTPMTVLYGNFSPMAAAFSGNTKTAINDAWTAAVTNTMGTGGVPNSFVSWFERAFGMRNLNMQLPYSGTTVMPDSGANNLLY
jgi:hypothetical protein